MRLRLGERKRDDQSMFSVPGKRIWAGDSEWLMGLGLPQLNFLTLMQVIHRDMWITQDWIQLLMQWDELSQFNSNHPFEALIQIDFSRSFDFGGKKRWTWTCTNVHQIDLKAPESTDEPDLLIWSRRWFEWISAQTQYSAQLSCKSDSTPVTQ